MMCHPFSLPQAWWCLSGWESWSWVKRKPWISHPLFHQRLDGRRDRRRGRPLCGGCKPTGNQDQEKEISNPNTMRRASGEHCSNTNPTTMRSLWKHTAPRHGTLNQQSGAGHNGSNLYQPRITTFLWLFVIFNKHDITVFLLWYLIKTIHSHSYSHNFDNKDASPDI